MIYDMGSSLAIFVALASFFFTLYQYWLTMYFRRPHLRLVRFNLGHVLLNRDYKDFIVYPRLNFVLVNMSDIANSLLDIKAFCIIGDKSYEAKIDGTQDLLPISIAGHAAETATSKGRDLSFSFPYFPTREELKTAKLVVELYDQYDRVYKFRFDSKWFEKGYVIEVPRVNEHAQYLAEMGYISESNKEPNVHHLIYNYENKDSLYISATSFGRDGRSSGGSYFTPEIVKQTCANTQETRIPWNGVLGDCKLYFIKEANGAVKSLEVEIPGKPMVKIELPAEFVTAIENFQL